MKGLILSILSISFALSGGAFMLLAPAVYFTAETPASLFTNPMAPTLFAVSGFWLFAIGLYFHHLEMVEYWGEDWENE